MAGFEIPDWATPQTPTAPPPDPIFTREEKIANDTRAEQALNGFIAGKQAALFEAPDAFYRTQGSDAIHSAPGTAQKLDELRRDLLDRLGNDTQRQRLADALDAQMHLAREGMSRHVAEQSLEWQRGVAQDRIALLTKEATLHHNDDELVNSLGHAAATAARARARVGAGPPGGETEDAAAATARSGVLGAAIQARLDRGDTEGANALFTQVQDQLDPTHAAPLQGQIEQVLTPPLLVHPEMVGRGTIEPEAATPGTDEAASTESSPVPAAPESANEADRPPDNALSPAGPTSASTVALPEAGTISEAAAAAAKKAAGAAAKAASRVAPYLGRAASGLGAAATVLLVPGNTQATTTELGDGIRIRSAPGQRTVTIERRVDNGILGTGIGARWEELPVQAEHATAPDGRSVIAIDPHQLESAIGAEAMGRIAPQGGVSMARPPRDGEGEQPPGIGHNSTKGSESGDDQKPPEGPIVPPVEAEGKDSNPRPDSPYFSSHAWTRIQQRGISPSDLQDAIKSGKGVVQPNGNIRYTVRGTTVVLSPEGKLVTVFN